MKKKIFLFLTLIFIMPLSVFADRIYNIDMNIYIDEEGNANVRETWNVKASGGSEWYKAMYELNNSELTNFKVSMDGVPLIYRSYWDTSGSLESKKGYYGINYADKGMELCFGKADLNEHIFTLTYDLSNYVFNTSDSQVLAWVLMPKIDMDSFSAEVSSYYRFPDTLDVWGYGYKGYAYVENGKIKMSNEGKFSNNYVSLLVKFPLDTFKTINIDPRYDSFSDVYNVAEEGTFDYDYDFENNSGFNFFYFLNMIIPFVIFVSLFVVAIPRKKYGYIFNKKIDKKNISPFRELPCQKNIYYANALLKLNNIDYKEGNILGAIILKWVKEGKIIFKNETRGVFNKNTTLIDLRLKPTFDNSLEQELFDIMLEASIDGVLEANELETWCKNHYSKFLDIFNSMTDNEITRLKGAGHIYRTKNKKECKNKFTMDDKIYNDSVELYGLEKFLIEFSNMKEKVVMDVHLWDEYLMFAYLFGIADKVAKQLKDMYPEVIQEIDMDLDTLIFIDHISTNSVYAASSARRAAQSYSSGGGGFSSGGGGGFSGGFSGGGGGSAGGR